MAAEDAATEAQIKHLYGVIHGLGMDPKEWKKNSNIGSFAKLTRKQCSDYITELEAMEAEQKAGSSQPAAAPAATTIPTTDNRAEAEAQRIREEQGLARRDSDYTRRYGNEAEGIRPDIEQPIPILTPEMATPAAPPKPTVPELIAKYTDILAQVTEAVRNNDIFLEREKGYSTNWVANAVKGAMENGKGGDREE